MGGGGVGGGGGGCSQRLLSLNPTTVMVVLLLVLWLLLGCDNKLRNNDLHRKYDSNLEFLVIQTRFSSKRGLFFIF